MADVTQAERTVAIAFALGRRLAPRILATAIGSDVKQVEDGRFVVRHATEDGWERDVDVRINPDGAETRLVVRVETTSRPPFPGPPTWQWLVRLAAVGCLFTVGTLLRFWRADVPVLATALVLIIFGVAMLRGGRRVGRRAHLGWGYADMVAQARTRGRQESQQRELLAQQTLDAIESGVLELAPGAGASYRVAPFDELAERDEPGEVEQAERDQMKAG